MLLVITACGGGQTEQPTETTASPAEEIQTQVTPVEAGGSYRDVNANDLATMTTEKDFVLVNVHVPYEREIEGTDLFIAFDRIMESQDTLPTNLDSKIVVYCRSGSMSAIASSALVKLGYTDVWNLDGGMIAWGETGHSLIDRSR